MISRLKTPARNALPALSILSLRSGPRDGHPRRGRGRRGPSARCPHPFLSSKSDGRRESKGDAGLRLRVQPFADLENVGENDPWTKRREKLFLSYRTEPYQTYVLDSIVSNCTVHVRPLPPQHPSSSSPADGRWSRRWKASGTDGGAFGCGLDHGRGPWRRWRLVDGL
jgi:hypothetical protein